MKKVAASLLLISSCALYASEQVEYSVAEFCEITGTNNSSIIQKGIEKAYIKKLGFKPSREQCLEEKHIKFITFKPYKNNYDFFMNKPYRGSVIRLSQSQVTKLRAANASHKEIMEIITSVDK